MRKALMLASAGLIILAGCSRTAEDGQAYSEEAAAEASADVGTTTAQGAPAPTEALAPRPAPLAPVARIAYAYRYALSLPRDRGAEMMSRHELACVSAGPGYCQVISAQADWTAREPGGRLELRGQPEWINRFRSGLALDAQNAGGRLDEAVTEGEDVTRGIDEASTGAKTTASLADRIRQLQARSGGTLAQRLEIERQLAELQQLYDAQQIELRALNDRVQSARLTLDYRQGGVMAADSPTRPVARALGDAFGLSMGMLAVLITAGSVLLPVVVIGVAVWWALRRRRPAPAA
ncbi:DUF4349 domain-containing protein [Brevundimonas sp.]|uniref:DUF4349 domain-containing protein n=1 Tax=Brevundimonas sp. TaxID=1871086 RepID=UPI002737DE5B|nr:DUF4349 domain-containing protein [Brevundimonas sp.]MDP3802376.1 DUF4349 domain-containing protein [Brevundimonas sp.]